MTRPVCITIDQLVLRGFPAGARAGVAAGLQRELALRVRDLVREAPPTPGTRRVVPHLHAGTMVPAASPEAAGTRAARLVAKRLPL